MELSSLTAIELGSEMRNLSQYSDNSDECSPYDDSMDDNDALLTTFNTFVDSSTTCLSPTSHVGITDNIPVGHPPTVPQTATPTTFTPTSSILPTKKRSRPKTNSSNKPPKGASCRICSSRSPSSKLICPCACTGSVAYVHTHCLQRWIDVRPHRAGAPDDDDSAGSPGSLRTHSSARPPLVRLPYIDDAVPTSSLHVCEMCRSPYDIALELKYRPSARKCWSSGSVGAAGDVGVNACIAALSMGICVGMIGNLVQFVDSTMHADPEDHHNDEDGEDESAGGNSVTRAWHGAGVATDTNSASAREGAGVGVGVAGNVVLAAAGAVGGDAGLLDERVSVEVEVANNTIGDQGFVSIAGSDSAAGAGGVAEDVDVSVGASAGVLGGPARHLTHPFGALEADMCVTIVICCVVAFLAVRQLIRHVLAWRACNSVVRIKARRSSRLNTESNVMPVDAEVVIERVPVEL